MEANRRILIADDSLSIHEDFRKVLQPEQAPKALTEAEALLFRQKPDETPTFELTFATQGEEAIRLTTEARRAGRPIALAFVDVRMPPGIDGVATVVKLWEIEPDLQVVICTAHSDKTWNEMTRQLGRPDQWVILHKPFDKIEVLQLAYALTQKWGLAQQARAQVADLETRVTNRTAELVRALEELKRQTEQRARIETEQRALQRKFEETQRLESLGVLAGGIAHDFNNILTGILGSASLARLDLTPGHPLDQHLKRIEKSASRAAELCEQMLAYAGKGRGSVRPLDLNTVVRDTMELLHASVPRDATLAVDLPADLPRVMGDVSHMRQVVMNLVINAAEALSGQPRRVSLSTRSAHLGREELAKLFFPGEAEPGEFVCIEVTDSGVGMRPDTLRRIFEPFYTTKFAGRGLGLCAVQGIIRSRCGALDVASEFGKGSTFRAYFPVAPNTTSTVSSAPKPAPMPSSPLPTVLVVDDEQPVRDIAALALRRLGYRVQTAANGAEAVALVQESDQALAGVLLDLTMPELDGLSTLHALRQLRPGLRAVLMSGYDQTDAMRRFDGLGLSAFLQKPFTVESLRDKVSTLTAPEPQN